MARHHRPWLACPQLSQLSRAVANATSSHCALRNWRNSADYRLRQPKVSQLSQLSQG